MEIFVISYLVILLLNSLTLRLRYIGGSFIDAFYDTNKLFLIMIVISVIYGILFGGLI